MSGKIVPLGFLKPGYDALVTDFDGGIGLRQRLTEMGLFRGAKVKVIKNDMGGPLIISNGDGRLAIGRGMALRIMVEEVAG